MIKLGYWLNKNLIELDTWTCLSMKAIIMSHSMACIIFSRVMDWIEKVYRHNRISQYFYTAIVLIFELCIVVSSSIIFFFKFIISFYSYLWWVDTSTYENIVKFCFTHWRTQPLLSFDFTLMNGGMPPHLVKIVWFCCGSLCGFENKLMKNWHLRWKVFNLKRYLLRYYQ